MKPLNAIEKRKYVRASNCYLCWNAFLGEDDSRGCKVRNHKHITANFLAAAHRQCNIERLIKYLIPLLFIHFKGYDTYLIFQQFLFHKKRALKELGKNKEKYFEIQWGHNIVFRDLL